MLRPLPSVASTEEKDTTHRMTLSRKTLRTTVDPHLPVTRAGEPTPHQGQHHDPTHGVLDAHAIRKRQERHTRLVHSVGSRSTAAAPPPPARRPPSGPWRTDAHGRPRRLRPPRRPHPDSHRGRCHGQGHAVCPPALHPRTPVGSAVTPTTSATHGKRVATARSVRRPKKKQKTASLGSSVATNRAANGGATSAPVLPHIAATCGESPSGGLRGQPLQGLHRLT